MVRSKDTGSHFRGVATVDKALYNLVCIVLLYEEFSLSNTPVCEVSGTIYIYTTFLRCFPNIVL